MAATAINNPTPVVVLPLPRSFAGYPMTEQAIKDAAGAAWLDTSAPPEAEIHKGRDGWGWPFAREQGIISAPWAVLAFRLWEVKLPKKLYNAAVRDLKNERARTKMPKAEYEAALDELEQRLKALALPEPREVMVAINTGGHPYALVFASSSKDVERVTFRLQMLLAELYTEGDTSKKNPFEGHIMLPQEANGTIRAALGKRPIPEAAYSGFLAWLVRHRGETLSIRFGDRDVAYMIQLGAVLSVELPDNNDDTVSLRVEAEDHDKWIEAMDLDLGTDTDLESCQVFRRIQVEIHMVNGAGATALTYTLTIDREKGLSSVKHHAGAASSDVWHEALVSCVFTESMIAVYRDLVAAWVETCLSKYLDENQALALWPATGECLTAHWSDARPSAQPEVGVDRQGALPLAAHVEQAALDSGASVTLTRRGRGESVTVSTSATRRK